MVAVALKGRQLAFVAEGQLLPYPGEVDAPLPVTGRAAALFDAGGRLVTGFRVGDAQGFMEQKAESLFLWLQLGFGLELPGVRIERNVEHQIGRAQGTGGIEQQAEECSGGATKKGKTHGRGGN